MKTHEQYVLQLKNLDIKTIPIEKYIKNTIKIKHKCICGNTWYITPKNALKNQTCGCKPNNINMTHNEYLNKLKEKKIQILPVEKYIGMVNKIKHKCTCGNIWSTLPLNVISGQRCGCKGALKYRNRRTIYYYIEIDFGDKKLYKPGVAIWEKYKTPEETILKQRYGKNKNIKIKILNYKVFDNGEDAIILEKNILHTYKKYKYNKDDLSWFDGKSELLYENIEDAIRIAIETPDEEDKKQENKKGDKQW